MRSAGFCLCLFFAVSVLSVRPVLADAPKDPILVGSWGGAYQAAAQKVLFDGFASRSGISITPITLTGLDSIKQALNGPGARLAVADVPAADAEALCAEGLAEPTSSAMLANQPTDGIEKDFLVPLGNCGIPSTLSAEVVLYDKDALGTQAPSRVSDIFDIVHFPGKRALKRDAQGTLEWALLADDVSPEAIYSTLSTPEGADRAFAKLDQIRDLVMWWEHGDVPVKALARKDVVMAAAFGTRAYQAIVGDGHNFGILWNGALISDNRWVLLKGHATDEAALEFIKFATDRERLAALSRELPYAPARQSALADIPPEKLSYLASGHDRISQSIQIDQAFWRKNGEALRQRFAAWLATTPARSPKTAAAPSPQSAKPAPATKLPSEQAPAPPSPPSQGKPAP